jgi:hypothetical protein
MPCIIMYAWPNSQCVHPESSDPGRFHSTWKAGDLPWWQAKTLDVVWGQLSTEAAVFRLDIRPKRDFLFTNLGESTWPRELVPAELDFCNPPLQVLTS